MKVAETIDSGISFFASISLFDRWIVVQPSNKNLRGRYLEKVGYWLPRKTKTVQRAVILNRQRLQYWLGVRIIMPLIII